MHRSMYRSFASTALALGIAGAGSQASAQPTPPPAQTPRPAAGGATAAPKKAPTPADLAEARKHFQAAETAKARAEYQTAAVEYLAAYELFQEPAFFYDTAEVYRLAGDEKSALAYYEKYLELDAHGQGAANARTAVDLLRRSIAAKEDAAQKAAAESRRKPDPQIRPPARPDAAHADRPADAANPATSSPVASTPPAPSSQPAAPAAPADDDAAKPSPAPSPGRGLRIGGIAAGGTGLVALGVGVVFGFKARSLSDQVSNETTYDKSRDDQGHAAQRNMYIFTGIGAAALATGGVLYYLGDRARRTEHPALTVAPAVSPSQITFAVSGRF